ncbi:MAG: aminoglycoside phosphotransferase family protein [Actinobacteria bacterium]|nr:aminoglycoside phosphotransferase family protein [Actinomycetota bacterium]
MTDEIRSAVAEALGEEPAAISRLHGGANNVVARIDVGGRPLVAKIYFTHPGDPRDRLGTEFRMLTFLWSRGIRSIPEPVAMNRDAGVAVYEYIEGDRATEPVTLADMHELVELLAAMREAASDAGAEALPSASDASFDVRGRLDEVDRRLARLRKATVGANDFVENELEPAVRSVQAWAFQEVSLLGIGMDDEGSKQERMLSPGDLGFHNVLRTESGLRFLDFEYGGWDDVAQVIAQTCLAPEVPLAVDLHPRLIAELLDRLDARDTVARLRILYPLLALKWSMIVLNELIDVDRARREFAGVVRDTQIEKSRTLIGLARDATTPGFALDSLLAG